ncbi:hypothetical protein RDWZM_004899 [Blomia tropicalis]|uniref:Uncharacterized protein n=1 Tax=Blomia tropicalis TaxID=40697 RepID=A0A9Q0M703_BLOTA|nr:hypothetical protein RDWZM_004899 [Blomia tropicalis]
MNKFIFAVIAAFVLVFATNVEAGRKGGDIIIMGGNGGFGGFGGMGDGMILSTGGKKKGSIILIGRRRRSINSNQ